LFEWILKRVDLYCETLKEEADFEAKRKLAKVVKEKGEIEVYKWVNQNLELVLEYLSLPASRRKAKKWQKHQPMLQLAAYALCRIASDFVKRADRLGMHSELRSAIAFSAQQGFQMIFFSPIEDFVLDFFDGYPEDYLP
jgi:hypothetical protein